jgi:hypothetical protein
VETLLHLTLWLPAIVGSSHQELINQGLFECLSDHLYPQEIHFFISVRCARRGPAAANGGSCAGVYKEGVGVACVLLDDKILFLFGVFGKNLSSGRISVPWKLAPFAGYKEGILKNQYVSVISDRRAEDSTSASQRRILLGNRAIFLAGRSLHLVQDRQRPQDCPPRRKRIWQCIAEPEETERSV